MEVGRGKDHPDIFVEAANRLGVNCRECLVFEDIVPAVLSASRAGMSTCGVRANDPTQDVDKMRSVADLWLEDWLDVPLS
jgi:beta-phosphoglucomutase-like phosphatase (HAD superfamily)